MQLIKEISEDLQHDDITDVYKVMSKSASSNPLKPGDALPDEEHENPRIKQAIDELNKLIVSLEFSDDVENLDIVNQATSLRDALKQELHKTMPDTQPAPQPGSNLAPQIFTHIG